LSNYGNLSFVLREGNFLLKSQFAIKIELRKYMLYKSIFLTLLLTASVFGQQVKIYPFSVTPSNILDELKKIKISNPNMMAQELSDKGDLSIAAKGLNFVFLFDAEICQTVTGAIQKQKDKSIPVKLNAKINSVEGDIASISLPEIKFDSGGCGKCYVQMPMVEFSDKEFVTFIQDRSVRFYTPKNIFYEEISLLETKNSSNNIRTWKVPFRSKPLAISDDGKMIALDLPFDELKEIALLIYDDGTFRFYPKKDLDLTAKSEILKEFAGQPGLTESAFISFSKGEQKHILKFNKNCQ